MFIAACCRPGLQQNSLLFRNLCLVITLNPVNWVKDKRNRHGNKANRGSKRAEGINSWVGCNAFGKRIDETTTHAVIDAAIDAGMNFFDTAETYGGGLSEKYIGSGMKGRRDNMIIATKFGHSHSNVEGKKKGSPENVKATAEKALKALRTDRIDLFQQHRPDSATPVAETLGALEDLVKEGKILFYGCSYYSGVEMQEAIDEASKNNLKGFVTAQNSWNMLTRDIETDLIPVCASNNIGLLPYYPIAKGLLTDGINEATYEPEPYGWC